jgi:hypothetical protein
MVRGSCRQRPRALRLQQRLTRVSVAIQSVGCTTRVAAEAVAAENTSAVLVARQMRSMRGTLSSARNLFLRLWRTPLRQSCLLQLDQAALWERRLRMQRPLPHGSEGAMGRVGSALQEMNRQAVWHRRIIIFCHSLTATLVQTAHCCSLDVVPD